MGFSRQAYWSGLPGPSPECLPYPGIKPTCLISPAFDSGSFTLAPPGKPKECWYQFSSVQSRSRVRLFATPWTAACQASLFITNSRSPPKPMSTESVMPSSHLILRHPLLLLPHSFPASGSFQMSQLFASGGQSFGVSASTSVLPMNIQDWSSLGWTAWISLQSKGLSRVFSPQFKSINSLVLSFLYSPTLTSIHDYWKNDSLD